MVIFEPLIWHRFCGLIFFAQMKKTAMHIGQTAMPSEFKAALAHSVPFLEVMGYVVMAWMLLWHAVAASQKMEDGVKKKDLLFYEGQIKSAEFFIQGELPVTMGKCRLSFAAHRRPCKFPRPLLAVEAW
jgi:hypothetical protein